MPSTNNPISFAQEMLIESMSEQFGFVSKDTVILIESIEDINVLKQLARELVKCKGLSPFENLLIKASKGKINLKHYERRGTDEAFLRLMGISGAAMIKLMGFSVGDPTKYRFKAVVLKEKRLEPDIEGIPMLEAKGKKIFMEFQGFHDKFIRYRAIANALTGCSHEKYDGQVCLGIIYTDEAYKKAAIDISMFPNIDTKALTSEIKEVVLTDYTLQQLLDIDPRLIVLAPFTEKRNTKNEILSSRCREWKQEVEKHYSLEESEDAIKLIGLFLLNRFVNLTREEIIAMLNFDLMNTVAGKQLYDEGRGIGKKEGKEESIIQLIKAGLVSDTTQALSVLGIKDKRFQASLAKY